MTDEQYNERKNVAEWLNTKGLDIEIDRDGFWMEEYRFSEFKVKDVIDFMIEFSKNSTVASIPNSYLLAYDEARDQEISAVATLFKDKKPARWAVRRGNSCMGRTDGAFIYEPQPSSRDDEYFAEYRFATIEDAERIYLSFHSR